jgi:hypothetical protein
MAYQAISQLCAFRSPFQPILSAMAMLRQERDIITGAAL